MNQETYNDEITRLEIRIDETKNQPLLRVQHEAYIAQLQELKEKFGGSFKPPPLLPPPAPTPQLPSLSFFKIFKQEILILLEVLPANWFFLLIVLAVIALVSFPLFLVMHFF